MVEALIIEISILFVVASLFTFLAARFKQPLIVAYLVSGLLISLFYPFHYIQDLIPLFITGGLIILIYYSALSLDLSSLRRHFSVSLAGGFVAISFLIFFSFWLFERLGLKYPDSLYLAIAISFGSPFLIESFLREKGQRFTLHGEIVQGIVTLETTILITIITLFEKLSSVHEFSLYKFFYSFSLGIVIFLLLFLYLPRILEKLFVSEELGLLASILLPFLGATLFSFFGFPYITGAFLIGLALSNHSITMDLFSWGKSFKDFISALFFISLGFLVYQNFFNINLSGFLVFFVIILSITLLLKPLLTTLVLLNNHYRLKTSFLASSFFANLSELSLVLLLSGVSYHIISEQTFVIFLYSFIFTSVFSVYFTKYKYKFYKIFIYPTLKRFEKHRETDTLYVHLHRKEKIEANILLVGVNRIGRIILQHLAEDRTKKFVVIDYNHKVVNELIKEGHLALYGDATDPDILDLIDLSSLEVVISTIPEVVESEYFIKEVKKRNKNIFVFAIAYSIEGALSLYSAGADYVALPHFLGGKYSVTTIEKSLEDNTFISQLRDLHIKELESNYF